MMALQVSEVQAMLRSATAHPSDDPAQDSGLTRVFILLIHRIMALIPLLQTPGKIGSTLKALEKLLKNF